jgi:OOP family OmpA-OmpF porin
MRAKQTLMIAAAAIVLPLMAQAQPVNGLYLGLGLGLNSLQSTDITGTYQWGGRTFKTDGENAEFSLGFGGVVSLGWGFGNGLRAEIEGSYRRNETDQYTLHSAWGAPQNNATGTAISYGPMVNLLYDFDLRGRLGGLTPYLGVGVGYIWQKYDDVGYTSGGANGARWTKSTYSSSSGDPGAFAGQVIAGLSFPISALPGLSVTAEYRFLGTAGHNFNRNNIDGTDYRADVDVDNYNHSVFVGLRYAFNTAPRPVAAVAPLPTTRTFLVFFDWSKADLTDRARQIIGEAAVARGQGVTRIEVNGFTDRSGPADYNMQLSIRRANAVAGELVRRGVPSNEIVTRGFGEENNLVPTADGVREPQNRRVEIIMR